MATRVAIDEGFYAEEGIEGIEVITAEGQIRRLRDGDVDIIQGDTGALLAAANRTGLEEEAVLLLGGYRAYGYLAAQLEAREFIYDEANTEAVLEIMEALVRSEQAQGRLPAHFRWEEHFNPEALLYTQKEAGLAHNPQERELPSRPEKRVGVG